MEKPITEMTEKEILCRQLKILAEKSENCNIDNLIRLSTSMAEITQAIAVIPRYNRNLN